MMVRVQRVKSKRISWNGNSCGTKNCESNVKMPPNVDAISTFVMDTVEANPKMLVSWYLVLSYAYYEMNESLVHDHVFDHICKELLSKIENFEIEHKHLYLVDAAALEAGTGHHITEWPSQVVSVAVGFTKGIYTPYDL